MGGSENSTAGGRSGARWERYALLALVLCFFVALKTVHNPRLGRNSLDGDYYFQIARHVAEGDGFVTSVSLYHQGFQTLPHPATVYPLWPLVLGSVGRSIPLGWASTQLPEALFLFDLLLVYWLGNRLMWRLRGARRAGLFTPDGAFEAGHLAALLLGTSWTFFYFTSLPYTEALAFCLLPLGLIALDKGVDEGVSWTGAAGAVLGLAYLTRSQALMALVAVTALLAGLRPWAPDRRRPLLVFVACAAAVLLPWFGYLAVVTGSLDPRQILQFDSFREAPMVPAFQSLVEHDTIGSKLRGVMSGLVTAFDPRSALSYARSFGLATLVVPIAAVWAAVRWRSLGRWLRDHERGAWLLPAATALSGFLMVAPLHLLQSTFLWEWRFGHRQGLPYLLILLVALFATWALGGRWLRRGVAVLAALTVGLGLVSVTELSAGPRKGGIGATDRALVGWLDAHDGMPVVLTTNPQTLSVYSRAGFHWMECREPWSTTRALLENVPIDYLIVYSLQERCPFASGAAILPTVGTLGDETMAVTVYANPWRKSDTPPATPPLRQPSQAGGRDAGD